MPPRSRTRNLASLVVFGSILGHVATSTVAHHVNEEIAPRTPPELKTRLTPKTKYPVDPPASLQRGLLGGELGDRAHHIKKPLGLRLILGGLIR